MVWDLRMPRTVIGILAGGALAIAGALLQAITKNPLAASDTLGINAGAYFVVVLGAVMFPALLHQAPFLFAAIGGLLAAVLAYFMGGGRAGSPIRLALAGLIVSMVLGSFTGALHIFTPLKRRDCFSGVPVRWCKTIGVVLLMLGPGLQGSRLSRFCCRGNSMCWIWMSPHPRLSGKRWA